MLLLQLMLSFYTSTLASSFSFPSCLLLLLSPCSLFNLPPSSSSYYHLPPPHIIFPTSITFLLLPLIFSPLAIIFPPPNITGFFHILTFSLFVFFLPLLLLLYLSLSYPSTHTLTPPTSPPPSSSSCPAPFCSALIFVPNDQTLFV